jgi:2-iminobutanoate/2-iminopropanoate deaminase
MSTSLERKNYSQLEAPVGPYVHAVKYNGMLFVSGLTAFGTPAAGQGLAEQARVIFEQIAAIAKAEQTDLTALIKVTLFVTSLDQVAALRGALFEIYGKELPASSLVQVSGLFSSDIQLEVEAILAMAG